MPGVDHYTVIINKRELIDEVQRAPDDKVSFRNAVAEVSKLLLVHGRSIFDPLRSDAGN